MATFGKRLILLITILSAINGVPMMDDGSIGTSSKRTLSGTEKSKGGRPKKKRFFGNKTVIENWIKLKHSCDDIMGSEIEHLKNRIKMHLEDPIARPGHVDEHRHNARRLCRLAYHVHNGADDLDLHGKRISLITSFYNVAWEKFRVDRSRICSDGGPKAEDLNDQQYGDLFNEVKDSMQWRADVDQYEVDLEVCRIRGRMCDADCEQVDDKDASRIYTDLLDFVTNPDKNLPCPQHVMNWVEKYEECYQGLRSVVSKLRLIHRLQDAMEKVEASERKDHLSLVIDETDLPDSVKILLWNQLGFTTDSANHTEDVVYQKYQSCFQKFTSGVQKKKDKFCDICNMMCPSDGFQKLSANDARFGFSQEKSCELCGKRFDCVDCKIRSLDVDRTCVRRLRKEEMPPLSSRNNLNFLDMPEPLADLNCIERMLIKRAQVRQTVIRLKDVGEEGVCGATVIVPAPVQLSALKKLPSAHNLKIQVHSNWNNGYIVCMKKLVAALEWLKQNNPEYADIEINDSFRFKIEKHVEFETDSGATQEDADKLVRRPESPQDPLLRIVEEVEQSQEVNQSTSSVNPSPLMDALRDLWAFPELLPHGQAGMKSEREIKIKSLQYLRSVLLNRNRILATSMQYLRFQFAEKLLKHVTSCQGVQGRITKTQNTESGGTISGVFSKIRGFTHYWKYVRSRLSFHVALFGPATWLITLKPNETHWKDILEIYAELKGREVTSETIRSEIQKDPVIFSRYWNLRVQEYLKTVLLVDDGPLGTVIHYFWRTKYEHSGAPNAHCMIWTADHPSADASPAELRKFIDSRVTARMPDPDTEPNLYDLVKKLQIHKCLPACSTTKEARGKTIKCCRFNFPRKIQPLTTINDRNTSGHQQYDLARKHGEQFINDYSPAMLLSWEGSVDMQFIGSDKSIVSHVTVDTSNRGIDKKAVSKCGSRSRHDAIYALGMEEIGNKEVGVLEIVDHLLGHNCFEFDAADVWIPTDPSGRRKRMSKSKREADSGGSSLRDNLVDHYYPNRDPRLENFSLYNIAINFEPMTKGGKALKDPVDSDDSSSDSWGFNNQNQHSPFYNHPMIPAGTGMNVGESLKKLVKRKQKIGRFYLPALDDNDVQSREDFYRRLCLLFVPWRDETKLLKSFGKETFHETFNAWLAHLEAQSKTAHDDVVGMVKSLKEMRENFSKLGRQSDGVEEALDMLDINDDDDESTSCTLDDGDDDDDE